MKSKIREIAQSNPPRCISNFKTLLKSQLVQMLKNYNKESNKHSIEKLDEFKEKYEYKGIKLTITGEDDSEIEYQLLCQCDSKYLKLSGYYHKYLTSDSNPENPLFCEPHSIICSICGEENTLFNSETDGYTGEIENFKKDEIPWLSHSVDDEEFNPKEEFKCPKCGETEMKIVVSFEFLEEKDFDEEDEYIDSKRPQDYFSWFSLYGKCKSCEKFFEITNYECA